MPTPVSVARKMWPAQVRNWEKPVWPDVTSKIRTSPSVADIFPEALQSADEFRDFAKEIDRPLLANMTEFGKSPLLSIEQLSDFGYRMVIFPMSAFRVAMKASEAFFRGLKKTGTQSDWLDKMQTRQELYDLLDYDPAAEEWSGFRD